MTPDLLYGLVILSAIAHAVWNALMKSAGDRALTMVAIRTAGLILGLAALPFVDWPAPGSAVGLFAGAVSVAGFLAYLVAARSLPLGPVTALRETSVIFGAVLGTLVLKEGFGARRIAAASLVTLGIMLLAFLR